MLIDVQHPVNDRSQPIDDVDIQLQGSHDQEMSNEGSQYADVSHTSEYVDSTAVRRKRTKVSALPRDRVLQVPNIVLQQWHDGYVSNMQDARRLKRSKQQVRQAKANAGLIFLGTGQPGPIRSAPIFADSLLNCARDIFQHLTGTIGVRTKRKRHRTSSRSDTSDSGQRRTRPCTDEGAEIARGGVENEEGYIAAADDIDPSIEIAREAMTMMQDYSTQLPLPWSGSRPGSVRSGRQSRQASILSSRAMGMGTGIRPGSIHSFDRRTSRLASVSPMLGHNSTHRSSSHHHESQSGLDDTGFLPGFDSGPNTSPQNRGRNNTQDVAESHSQLQDTLIRERTEFLVWIQNSIDARQDEGGEEIIRFDELLPTQQYARAVAAQGFLHVLVLANSNAITIKQTTVDEAGANLWWGSIDISINKDIAEDMIEI